VEPKGKGSFREKTAVRKRDGEDGMDTTSGRGYDGTGRRRKPIRKAKVNQKQTKTGKKERCNGREILRGDRKKTRQAGLG